MLVYWLFGQMINPINFYLQTFDLGLLHPLDFWLLFFFSNVFFSLYLLNKQTFYDGSLCFTIYSYHFSNIVFLHVLVQFFDDSVLLKMTFHIELHDSIYFLICYKFLAYFSISLFISSWSLLLSFTMGTCIVFNRRGLYYMRK